MHFHRSIHLAKIDQFHHQIDPHPLLLHLQPLAQHHRLDDSRHHITYTLPMTHLALLNPHRPCQPSQLFDRQTDLTHRRFLTMYWVLSPKRYLKNKSYSQWNKDCLVITILQWWYVNGFFQPHRFSSLLNSPRGFQSHLAEKLNTWLPPTVLKVQSGLWYLLYPPHFYILKNHNRHIYLDLVHWPNTALKKKYAYKNDNYLNLEWLEYAFQQTNLAFYNVFLN